MKKIITMLVAAGGILSAAAQDKAAAPKNYTHDADLGRWVIDLNLKGGIAGTDFKTVNSSVNYMNGVNLHTGQLKFRNGYSFGGDANIGFFFGKNRHFGLGTGIQFMSQHGNAVLDNYHVEYQATDGAGNTFRQVVNGNVKEEIRSNIINVPVVLKYKNRFSKHWGFSADAGGLINLKMTNNSTTRSSFDYEAIYKFESNDAGGKVSVYDNSPVASSNDWFITKAEFLRNNPNGNYHDYVNAKRALGYIVGEGLNPTTSTSKTNYNKASIGLLLQPSLNYFLSDKVALNLGVYYMFQPFKNDAQAGYRLTEGNGGYTSVLKSVTDAKNEAYGINIGARFFLGKKHKPLEIAAIESKAPSQCGSCDGELAISGLFPDQPVTVNYTVNGGQPVSFSSTVLPDGKVNIGNLCAGDYTGITVRIKRSSADYKPVTISAPTLRISSQQEMNPSKPGACDGSVKIKGLHAGNLVTINYNLNGSAQSAFAGTVASDNSVTMTGLCEGNYTEIVLSSNTCTVKGDNFKLAAPLPPPPPTVVTEEKVTEKRVTEENSTVLFDFDKSVIKKEYFHVLDQAIAEIREDEYIYIRINGYTDNVGPGDYNQKLSQRRADAVTKYFVSKGIKKKQIKVSAHGEGQPAESNKTAEGRMENRRVVIITSQ